MVFVVFSDDRRSFSRHFQFLPIEGDRRLPAKTSGIRPFALPVCRLMLLHHIVCRLHSTSNRIGLIWNDLVPLPMIQFTTENCIQCIQNNKSSMHL